MRKNSIIKVISAFVFLSCSFSLLGQDSWLQRPNVGGNRNREGASGFAIGDTGYITCGMYSDSVYHDFWAYVPSTNTWIKKDTLPAPKRQAASAASMNGYGYLMCGIKPSSCYRIGGGVCAGTFLNDVWQYTPSTGKWINISTFPGAARDNAVLVADPIDSLLFFGTGNNNTLSFLSDWWSYKPSTNTWTQLDSFPGGQRSCAVGFFSYGSVYVGTGNDNGKVNATSDFYKYNISSNTWTRVASITGNRRQASAFVINDTAYVGLGAVGPSAPVPYTDLWMYDAVNDTWTAKANYPQGATYLAIGFSINNKGYVATGTLGTRDSSLFWEYTPGVKDTTTGIATITANNGASLYPNPNNGSFQLKITNYELGIDNTMDIFNVLGEKVYSHSFSALRSLVDLKNQPSGVYFYRLLSNGTPVSTGKFIIEK